MNKKISKKAIITAIAATAMTAAMLTAGCGKVSYNVDKTESNSEISTVKDSEGNEYEVTHTITTENGNTTESYEGVPLEIYNETPDSFSGFYITTSGSNDWGDNLMVDKEGNDFVMDSGNHVWGETIDYVVEKPLVNIKVETTDGDSLEFTELDLTKIDNPEHVTITVSAENGSDEYTAQMK